MTNAVSRRAALAALVCALLAGCASIGPEALQQNRLQYNEAVKTTSEEQLLLNIVRLRYTDTPSSLAVSSIAVQLQQQSSLQLTPFLVAAGGDVHIRSFTSVLPQAQVLASDLPTLTLIPQDDQDF